MIAVGMISVSVENQRNFALQRQKAALELTRLRQEKLFTAVSIIPESGILSADMNGIGMLSRFKNMRKHRGRRSLSRRIGRALHGCRRRYAADIDVLPCLSVLFRRKQCMQRCP